jgi:hypothetical protein
MSRPHSLTLSAHTGPRCSGRSATRHSHLAILFGTTVLLAACDRAPSAPVAPAASITDASVSSEREIEHGSRQRYLIADQFNNRVIEVDGTGTILWHFGVGPADVGPTSIIGVNDAERVGELTLMAGTGAPPGSEPACAAGCADNRVILVNHAGHIVWQYGQFGATGAGPNQLNTPVQNTFLPHGNVLITDQGNHRVIEVERRHNTIVWQYGTTGVPGRGPDQLNNPNSAELLENGHVLIADENNDRAIEVDRTHRIVATYTAQGSVSGVAFASRLPNGHTLLTDSNNSRIVEVDATDHVVWQYVTNTEAGSNPAPLPTRAVRLRDGTTLISDQFNQRVIQINRAGAIVRSFGHLNAAGFGMTSTQQGLNAPYDAKVIGDFTGLTAPHDGNEDGA